MLPGEGAATAVVDVLSEYCKYRRTLMSTLKNSVLAARHAAGQWKNTQPARAQLVVARPPLSAHMSTVTCPANFASVILFIHCPRSYFYHNLHRIYLILDIHRIESPVNR